ncbi:hypothetical protein WQ54_16355 [Bacillus sp. SA1-12]|uniref:Ger(x)C family spore germination protein n=1 Tax=Bacillus sp. SA1-12 TaxID=1455638 RepID=UPI0006271781|nr:Ger(x)C family spore germination protein [Bacillus sp. SA1-12]KKI91173.1 hypothetical protein WQ54_16355 [Bacillus sp. SA1-12]
MNKYKWKIRFIWIPICCFFLIGCTRTTIIDDVKIIQTIGYDIENNKIKGTASYPVYVESMQESHPRKLFTAESKTTTGVFTSFSKQTAEEIDISQLDSVVIGDDFARDGISDLLVNLNSDPNIGTNSTLIISKKKARELLEESIKYPPYFLSSVLDQSMENGNVPLTNLHTISYQYYTEGQDMYIPKMEINNEGLLVGDGVGIFKNDKLRVSLNNNETFLLKMLVDRSVYNSTYEFTTSDNINLLVKVISKKTKPSVNFSNNSPEVSYHLTFNVYLKEQASKLTVSGINNSIKKEIETSIERDLVNLLEKLKNENVDPVGIGELYRVTQRNWKKNEFYKQIYPSIKFNIKVNVNIVNTGAAE